MSALSRYSMFRAEVEGLITSEIETIKDTMSQGLLKDHEQYKFVAGKIAGLRACLDLMDEADSIVSRKIGN